MAQFPRPKRIRLDGADAVVLTPEAFERLDAIRRQAGAQADRIHTLRQQLAESSATLEAIAEAARTAPCAATPDGHLTTCLREVVLGFVNRRGVAGSNPAT